MSSPHALSTNKENLYDKPILADIEIPEPTSMKDVLAVLREDDKTLDAHVHYGISPTEREIQAAEENGTFNQLDGYLGSQEQIDALFETFNPAIKAKLAFGAALTGTESYYQNQILSGKAADANYPLTSNLMDLSKVGTAKYVDGIIVYATDAPVVVGKRDVASGFCYTSNDAVFRLVEDLNQDPKMKGKKFYAGASINPASDTAIDELKYVKARGAKLVKMFFSVWGYMADGRLTEDGEIDPELRAKLFRFFDAASKLDMPVVVHTGYEDVILSKDGSDYYKIHAGDPETMMLLFESNLQTIVLAHTGFYSSHLPDFEHVENHMPAAVEAIEDNPGRVYGDVAGFNCEGYEFFGAFAEAIAGDHPDLLQSLIYGTDYPVKDYRPGELRKIIKLSKDNLRRKDLSDKDRRVHTYNLYIAQFLLHSPEFRAAKNPYDRRLVFTVGVMSFMGMSTEEQVAFFQRGYDVYVKPTE